LGTFPLEIQRTALVALEVARLGAKHELAKPWHGLAPGLFEIALNVSDAYRIIYTVRYREAVYVLHAFQKKSTQGIKTPAREVETIESRLRKAAADYRERYGKTRK
jgi:phage-related protein